MALSILQLNLISYCKCMKTIDKIKKKLKSKNNNIFKFVLLNVRCSNDQNKPK